MKKFFVLLLATGIAGSLLAQDSTSVDKKEIKKKESRIKLPKKDWSQVQLKNRSADHFMFQIGVDNWAGAPDSLRFKGLSRAFNAYFMFDFPFKTDPRWSVGLGAGVSTSGMFFDKMFVDVKAGGNTLPFRNQADTNHFKKFKLATTHLEAPIELRFALNPENMDKSWKFAIGAKVGTMLNAHTKGKTLQNRNGQTLNAYTQKETNRRFFNGTRLAGTLRVGYGNLSLFGAYSVTTLIKEGFGAEIRPYTIGITFSGL